MSNIKVPMKLSQLARELNINKSQLNYYSSLGLLPKSELRGKVSVYEQEELIERFKTIRQMQKKGKELWQIKETFANENN